MKKHIIKKSFLAVSMMLLTVVASAQSASSGYFLAEYDKLVIEFADPSPVALTLSCEGSAQISVGATTVEVATVNWAYNGNGGPNISGGTGSTEPVTLTIKKVTLVKEASTPTTTTNVIYYNPTYLLGDADNQKISFYSRNTNMYGGIVRNVTEDEMKTTQDGKTCLDLTFFQSLKNQGYHPITSDLKTWVKWQAACDGYYSDWIVTLTEAQRNEGDPQSGSTRIVLKEYGRVFCEDLGQVSNRDLDYNDVVFDAWIYVKQTMANGVVTNEVPYRTDIKLWAAGGTLPLQVAGEEVHGKFGVTTGTMVNTYTSASDLTDNSNCVTGLAPVSYTSSIPYSRIIDIPIVVRYGNNQIMELECNKGDAPHKFLVPVGTAWAAERVEISEAYPDFDKWVNDRGQLPWSNCVESNVYKDEENGSTRGEAKEYLTFKTEYYCAAQWDANSSTFTWGLGGENASWTFMSAEGISGDLSSWIRLHLHVSDFTNASAQKLTVVFKMNDGSWPPSGPTRMFVVSPDASGNIDIPLNGVDWGNCDITKIQDLTIYGCDRDDNSKNASVKITDAYYVKL